MKEKFQFKGSAADAKKELFADLKDRRAEASGARRKKNGSKSKACSLPSDRLTHRQWEKLNGPMNIFAMNVPTDYETLSKQSEDIQKEYIMNLLDRFNITVSKISEMLGISPSFGMNYVKTLGINYTPRGAKLKNNKNEKDAWNYFLAQVHWSYGYFSKNAAYQPGTIEFVKFDSNPDNSEIAKVKTEEETESIKILNKMQVTIKCSDEHRVDLLYTVLDRIKDMDIEVTINLDK